MHTVSSLEGYGTVMLGAPIENGWWGPLARKFLLAHRTELVALPVAVFATAPPTADPEDVGNDRGELLEELATDAVAAPDRGPHPGTPSSAGAP